MASRRQPMAITLGYSKRRFPRMPSKKMLKRDQNGRKMTQKGAIHQKNEPKQPNRMPEYSNHERMIMRAVGRSALYRAMKGKDDETTQ